MTNKTIGFYFLFATQFLLIVGKIFIDVKVGLFSLVFTILFLAIIFIQLNNDETTEWSSGNNGMLYLYSVWGIYYLFEILNPNAVIEVWNICLPTYALFPIICAFLVPIIIRDI